jgi:nitronate monooxygenase
MLGIELPIIQAPMAGVQGSELAVAVSNAGGLGSLPCAMLSLDSLGKELAAIATGPSGRTTSTFFVTPRLNSTASATALGERSLSRTTRPTAWTPLTHPRCRNEFRLAARQPMSWKGSGRRSSAFILVCHPRASWRASRPGARKSSLRQPRSKRRAGSRSTVPTRSSLKGFEAGGHRGMFLSADLSSQVGIFALLPRVIAAVRVPVIAAGGISDSQRHCRGEDFGRRRCADWNHLSACVPRPPRAQFIELRSGASPEIIPR